MEEEVKMEDVTNSESSHEATLLSKGSPEIELSPNILEKHGPPEENLMRESPEKEEVAGNKSSDETDVILAESANNLTATDKDDERLMETNDTNANAQQDLERIEIEESKNVSIAVIVDEVVVSSTSKEASDHSNEKEMESMEVENVEVETVTKAEEPNLEESPKDPEGVVDTGDVSVVDSSYYHWRYQFPPEFSPKCLAKSADSEFQQLDKEKKATRYIKGCKWAPDGSCLISCADDDSLRLFNFPSTFSSVTDWTSEDEIVGNEEWLSALKVKEGGLVYDYCWYPLMSSMDPVSSCFLSTSSEAPIHLWDAFTGKLRATYTPYNHLDQVISAYSLAFDPTGQTIYSGFEKSIRVFNITRPGRECTLRKLKQPLYDLNQYGIVASIAVNPLMSTFYAVGSFDKSIGLYYEDGSVICLLQGHVGGVTHMRFSSDGIKLFTGGRRDSRLICWDMRQMGEAYKIYDRVVSTHQRIYFDVTQNDRYLVSGGTDGVVKVWDMLNENLEPCCTFRSNSDCVNGVSLNPYVPLLATSSGQRHFVEVDEDSDDDELFTESKASQQRSCDIKLWKFV